MAIYIGIDPGEHTGIAVWDGGLKTFLLIQTMPLHRALDEVRKWHASQRTVTVVFEDARQRQWFQKERSVSEYRGKLMGAGAAKRDARIWEEFLTDRGIPFVAQAPAARMTKWNQAQFERFTGFKGRTSNHARDAALLVYGR